MSFKGAVKRSYKGSSSEVRGENYGPKVKRRKTELDGFKRSFVTWIKRMWNKFNLTSTLQNYYMEGLSRRSVPEVIILDEEINNDGIVHEDSDDDCVIIGETQNAPFQGHNTSLNMILSSYKIQDNFVTLNKEKADNPTSSSDIGASSSYKGLRSSSFKPAIHSQEIQMANKRHYSPHAANSMYERTYNRLSSHRNKSSPSREKRLSIPNSKHITFRNSNHDFSSYRSNDIITLDEDNSDVEEVADDDARYIDADEVKYVGTYPRNKPSSRFENCRRQKSLLDNFSSSYIHPRKESYTTSRFTANELIRLEEKAQYQLLLNKFLHGSSEGPPLSSTKDDKNENSRSTYQYGGFEKVINKIRADESAVSLYKTVSFLKMNETKSDDSSKNGLNSERAETKSQNKKDGDDDEDLFVLKPITPRSKKRPPLTGQPFSPEWLEQLKISVQEDTEEQLRVVKEHNRMIQEIYNKRDQDKSRTKEERAIADLNDRLFKEFTDEQLNIINDVLIPHPSDELLCTIDNYSIHRKEMDLLNGLNWLNDELINAYLELLTQRSKLDGYPSVFAFNSYFYTSLSRGYAFVKRWTRKLPQPIFDYDINLVPLHLDLHWALIVIDHRVKKVQYYDSMGGSTDKHLEVIRNYLIEEARNKQINQIVNHDTYTLEIMQNIPHQMNGSDCGMFTVKYAEYITRNATITFTQAHMQFFRSRMAYELITQKILPPLPDHLAV